MTSFEFQTEFDFALKMAKQAGSMIHEAFYKAKNIEEKLSIADLVTETDKNVEDYIIKSISENFPSHQFVGEETVSASNGAKIVLSNEPTWVVDPVDGTTNFVHQFPHTCVCIGFMHQKITQFGVVFNPITDELFAARLNFGATLNDQVLKINQSSPQSLLGSLVITEFGSSTDQAKMDFVFDNMVRIKNKGTHGIRSMGSCALNICFVASGRADAFYEIGMHIWDICAAGIVLREAGGVTTGINGEELDLLGRKIIAASNHSLGQEIAKTTTDFVVESD